MKYKKVLLIGNITFSKVYNNGKTLEMIFGNFPSEKLAQLYFNHNADPDFEFCQNYYRLTDTDIVKKWFSKTDKAVGREITGDILSTSPVQKLAHENAIFRILKKKSRYLSLFREYIWKANTWQTINLYKWIEDFNPQIIFLLVGSSGYPIDVALFIATKYNLPIVIFFTDDYSKYYNPPIWTEKIHNKIIKKKYYKLVEKASVCYGIGDLMCEEYKKIFNKPFGIIVNSINIKPYDNHRFQNKDEIEISYFGSLELNRWKMIIDFSKLIKMIEFQLGKKININVYSIHLPSNVKSKFYRANILYRGMVQGNTYEDAIQQADFLLFVESNDNFNRERVKLSVSTKISEYLISGIPIIGFGPLETASFQILIKNNVGFTISADNNIQVNMKLLLDYILDLDLQSKYSRDGYTFAEENFNAKKIRQSFDQVLNSIS